MKLKHAFKTAVQDGSTPAAGRWTAAEPGDRSRWLQTAEYTPLNVSRILEAANEGDIAELAIAAREIQERNWEVILAMQVRKPRCGWRGRARCRRSARSRDSGARPRSISAGCRRCSSP